MVPGCSRRQQLTTSSSAALLSSCFASSSSLHSAGSCARQCCCPGSRLCPNLNGPFPARPYQILRAASGSAHPRSLLFGCWCDTPSPPCPHRQRSPFYPMWNPSCRSRAGWFADRCWDTARPSLVVLPGPNPLGLQPAAYFGRRSNSPNIEIEWLLPKPCTRKILLIIR